MCVLKFLLPQSKMMLFTFNNYFDLPLKQVQVDLPLKLSCREGLIVAAFQGRLVVFMCVLKFSFLTYMSFSYLITQVDLSLLI